jgi:HlyD family secretion protein
LNLLNVQMEKLVVRAPVGAVVMSRKVEPGEIVQPGSSLMTLGELDNLSITVYIPEDRYGQVSLGDYATVSVDSFPGETFNAEVIRIADKAEFTPRNVQTPEGRRTTVFAVKLAVENPAGKLKPGMPADVVFESVHSSR